jgi:RimJ/RimL family protein N-acetyltransferase
MEMLMSTKRKSPRKYFDVRHLGPEDLDAYYKSLTTSNDYLGEYLDWGIHAPQFNYEDCSDVFSRMLKAKKPDEDFAICVWNQMVGQISFGPSSTVDGLQITYWVGKNHAGKGLGTKAVSSLIEIAFLKRDIRYLEIHVDRANLASAAIPKKLGFKLYDSYDCDDKGTKGSGIMDVYILLSPKEKFKETVAMLQNKPYVRLDVRPSAWGRKQSLKHLKLYQPAKPNWFIGQGAS